ncbi:hypothetical protein ACDY97_19045 [Rhizobium mongolense]|uniref:hypothetical protein n=1 Tax=Rhizobium mongolense TaxID=57676 RepID=UPI0035572CDF
MKLGTRQLELLRTVGTTSALVVLDNVSRRLCALGLMKTMGKDGDSFACITPNGLRALADAVDAGRIKLFVMPEKRGGE